MNTLYVIAPVLFLTAFSITYIMIPKILWIVSSLNLMDQPGHRSSHKSAVPTMAGIAFFISLILVLFLINRWDQEGISIHLIAAMTIIFVIGVKDDLVLTAPLTKFLGQLMAVLIVIWSGLYHTINMEGFLGLHHMPVALSYLFIVFIMLAIINAYNLLDGIDGLASITGLVILTTYSVIFFSMDLMFYGLLSFSLLGMLTAYLRFNFSNKRKIFMGDTGALIIGFCISFFTIKFLTLETAFFGATNFHPHDKIIIALVILFLPFLDTSRVIGVRMLEGKSPFYPDRNHVHHLMIDAGLSHKKTSLLLGICNLLLIAVFLSLSTYLDSAALLYLLMGVYLWVLLVLYLLRLHVYKNRKFVNALKRLYIILRVKNKNSTKT